MFQSLQDLLSCIDTWLQTCMYIVINAIYKTVQNSKYKTKENLIYSFGDWRAIWNAFTEYGIILACFGKMNRNLGGDIYNMDI